MHYYKRNIGDYHKKAGRLSMLEHGAYTLLIDAYYDREIAPTREQAIDWCWARTDEEVAAVEFVLTKFFEFEDGVYRQHRIEEEIGKYHKNAKINKRIAKEREEKKRTKRERSEYEPCTNEHEPPPNHKPRTINQEPKNTIGDLQSPCRFEEFWTVFADKRGKAAALKVWKRKKLDSRADEVIDGARRYVAARGSERRYWKQAQGWLNDERWSDDPLHRVEANEGCQRDTRSRARRVADRVLEIGLRDIEENGPP